MAKKLNHVWGMEIGQSSLKALRCHLEGGDVVADMFDFVEYPKILSQPEAEPEKLIADAIEQFMSRNDLRGAKVAISIPGQSGLAKFFKPPPVEIKKIPDIVKYEAKQQIPFDLNDVIWDFQQMAGSNIEDGYALESEVGLFAMKKEAVFRALKPFSAAGIDVDVIQLAPMAAYNMIAYDRFSERLANDLFDAEEPPASSVVLSMGTDASDLIVTNGFRVWQRSIPIGGNHFTRQLVKDLKLTFAKAEHLKRNVMQADDPKLIFQAMRPVFNDLVTEIQRSVGFFKSLNKRSEIENLTLLGNTAKLPGLQPYLNKNLGMDVLLLEKFERLSGSEVTGQPAFKENQAGFGVVYGLCLQLLSQGPMKTNLLPQEIVVERLVRSKKPWAIAALSVLLLGMVANFASVYGAFATVAPDRWSEAERSVADVMAVSAQHKEKDTEQKTRLALLTEIGEQVSSNGDRRLIWLELMKTIFSSLGRDPELVGKSAQELPYKDRMDFHVTKVDSVYIKDLSKWSATFLAKYLEETQNRIKLVGTAVPIANVAPGQPVPPAPLPPTGPKDSGWLVQIDGYHFFNGEDKRGTGGTDHIRKFLIERLENGTVMVPGTDGQLTEYSLKEMGISYPLLVKTPELKLQNRIVNPVYERLVGGAMPVRSGDVEGGGGSSAAVPAGIALKDEDGNEVPFDFEAPICYFTVQFVWQEKTVADRTWWREQKNYDKFAIPPRRVASVQSAAAPQVSGGSFD
ncbi:MAG: type IV pilus assembly protein PilM [Planctomycetota bacterium]|nr:type IV pilus assembly protein PilM [Planctomycetota bacterium]